MAVAAPRALAYLYISIFYMQLCVHQRHRWWWLCVMKSLRSDANATNKKKKTRKKEKEDKNKTKKRTPNVIQQHTCESHNLVLRLLYWVIFIVNMDFFIGNASVFMQCKLYTRTPSSHSGKCKQCTVIKRSWLRIFVRTLGSISIVC